MAFYFLQIVRMNNKLALKILLIIRSGKEDTSILTQDGYEHSQIIVQLEILLKDWYISLTERWITITDSWLEKIKSINAEFWNKNSNERISFEFESQIDTLNGGEIFIPQESEVDF